MIEPLGDRVSVVEPPVVEDKIILPPDVKGFPTVKGIVTAVGEDLMADIALGDTVYYWTGQETEVYGEKIVAVDALVAIDRDTRVQPKGSA